MPSRHRFPFSTIIFHFAIARGHFFRRMRQARRVSIRLDSIRCDAMRCDSIRFDSIRFDSIRSDPIRFDSIRLVSTRSDSVRFDSVVDTSPVTRPSTIDRESYDTDCTCQRIRYAQKSPPFRQTIESVKSLCAYLQLRRMFFQVRRAFGSNRKPLVDTNRRIVTKNRPATKNIPSKIQTDFHPARLGRFVRLLQFVPRAKIQGQSEDRKSRNVSVRDRRGDPWKSGHKRSVRSQSFETNLILGR